MTIADDVVEPDESGGERSRIDHEGFAGVFDDEAGVFLLCTRMGRVYSGGAGALAGV